MAESSDQRKIFLKIMKTIAVDVHASDTIEDIKAKVCATEGIRGHQQELFFAGNHLRDTTRTLADYNIPTNSTINLYVGGDGMQISITIPSSGNSFNLDVKGSDSVEKVKAKIADKEGISQERPELFYLGQPLKDHQTLSACNIRNNAMIQMVLRPIPMDQLEIFVELPCGKRIALQVRTWFTVRDAKMMMESMVGSIVELAYAGRNLEDHQTLSECEISDRSILQSRIQAQIFIKVWTGKTITLLVDDSDTVKAVMGKIEKKMGCNLNAHMLVYNGKRLEEIGTLGYYRVRKGETIHLRERVVSCLSQDDDA